VTDDDYDDDDDTSCARRLHMRKFAFSLLSASASLTLSCEWQGIWSFAVLRWNSLIILPQDSVVPRQKIWNFYQFCSV